MKTAIFAIFKAGKHTNAHGITSDWSENTLKGIAQRYNKNLFNAPLVIGHPEHNAPAYGEVNKLFVQDGILFAESRVDPTLEQQILTGRYNNISASFYLPSSKNSPIPNHHYLRHVGFLGAMAPAVKGLPKPIDAMRMATFNEYANFNRHDVVFFNEIDYRAEENRQALHEKALYIQRLTGMSYQDAIHTVLH